MIWSVSMLLAGSTTVRERKFAIPLTRRPRSPLRQLSWQQLAWIGDATAHRAGRGGQGACQQGAGTGALAAFEVAIARAHGIFPARHEISVHAEAHRAAGF